MHRCQWDKSSLCHHWGVLSTAKQKRKERAIFRRSPFISWKHLQDKLKAEANLLRYLNISVGLMVRQGEHWGAGVGQEKS